MDVSRRRAGVKGSAVAGSVWESRMNEVRGGMKVFAGDQENPPSPQDFPLENNCNNNKTGTGNNSTTAKMVKKGRVASTSGVSVSGKRKTWKSESFDGPIHIAKGKTEPLTKNVEESCKESSVSADGISVSKRSPIPAKKSGDGLVKSPTIQVKKGRSERNEKDPIQGRKLRSEVKEVDECAGQLGKVNSDGVKVIGQPSKGLDDGFDCLEKVKFEPEKGLEETVSGIEKNPPEETCEEFGICDEKIEVVKSPPRLVNEEDDQDNVVIDDDDVELEEEEEEEEEEIEIEVEKKSLEIKEIIIPEEKPKEVEETKEVSVLEEKLSKKLEAKVLPELKHKRVEISRPEKPKKALVSKEKKVQVHQFGNRTAPTSSTVRRQLPPVIKRATVYQDIPKPTPSVPVGKVYQSFPETHSHGKLQNLVDLVMWRDISRSAFVFGIGTFIIISSSYTKDLNVSSISVISYLGLVYLAAIFLHRSLISRGVEDIDDGSYLVGENEASWLLKLVLPYLNEFLLKIKALFSGDPATTMKMAVLLFVFARCGSSITIWKLAKLGFFGVFTVPKVCSSYSCQLTAYGKFWIRRLRDAWESCTHKRAVALAIFTFVWNLSSTVARVWAVFMMFVAVRYYQQTLSSDDGWELEDEEESAAAAAAADDQETYHQEEENTGGGGGGREQRQQGGSSSGPIKIPSSPVEENTTKAKKGS